LNTSSGLSPKPKQSTSTHLEQLNRYSALNFLADDTNSMETEQTNESSETITQIPPPIFIKSNLDYSGFCKAIQTAIGSNDFNCKSNLNEF